MPPLRKGVCILIKQSNARTKFVRAFGIYLP